MPTRSEVYNGVLTALEFEEAVRTALTAMGIRSMSLLLGLKEDHFTELRGHNGVLTGHIMTIEKLQAYNRWYCDANDNEIPDWTSEATFDEFKEWEAPSPDTDNQSTTSHRSHETTQEQERSIY